MATIQIRDIPENAYEVIRLRARSESMSIQAYMRQRVVEMASRPTKLEAVSVIEEQLARYGPAGASGDEIARDVAAERR